jgi:thiol-disulfide isomerase/thioredoxin
MTKVFAQTEHIRLIKAIGPICVLICALAVISLPAGAQVPGPASNPVYVKLRGIDGKMYDIAEMRGHVVLVSFGATWCQPCSAELVALEELKREYEKRPVRFLWVSIERKKEITDGGLRGFAKQRKLSFPVLRDPTQLTYAQFSTRVRLPLVVLFDKDGNVVGDRHFGISSHEDYKAKMRSALDELLAGSGSTSSSAGK